MKTLFFAAACVMLLSGCSNADWDNFSSYGRSGGDEAVAAAEASPSAPESVPAPQSAPQPAAATVTAAAPTPLAAAAAPNDSFCRAVATQDATRNGFDAPTQTGVFQRSYTQCLAIYTK